MASSDMSSYLKTKGYKDLYNSFPDFNGNIGYLNRRVHRFKHGKNVFKLDVDRMNNGLDRRVIEVLPGVFELDPKFVTFKLKLFERLSRIPICQISEKTGALTGTGIYKEEFSSLLSFMSIFPFPFGYPPYIPKDNKPHKENVEIYRTLAADIFSVFATTNAQLKNDSSSGFPFFSTDIDLKLKVLNYFVGKIKTEGLSYVLREYPLVYILGYRAQPENPGKDRFSFDIKGLPVAADKFIDVPDFIQNQAKAAGVKMGARRNRIIYAGSALNLLFTLLSQGFRNSYLDRYSSMFHFDASKSSHLLDYEFIYSSDIKNYDQHYPREYAWSMYDAFANALGESGISDYFRVFDILTPDFESGKDIGPVFLSSQRDDLYSGNNSGIPIVKELGVSGCITEMFSSQRRIGLFRQSSTIQDFLCNNSNSVVFNMNGGDDHITGLTRRKDMDNLMADLESNSFFEVEKEVPTKFLGHAIYEDAVGNRHFILTMNSYIKKRFCPEYSYYEHDLIRGDKERDILFSKHPSFGDVVKIRDDTFYEVFGISYYDKLNEAEAFNDRIAQELEDLNIPLNALSNIEREILEDPSKLQWKYKVDDLDHPEIAEIFFTSVPFEMEREYSHGICISDLLSLFPNKSFKLDQR